MDSSIVGTDSVVLLGAAVVTGLAGVVVVAGVVENAVVDTVAGVLVLVTGSSPTEIYYYHNYYRCFFTQVSLCYMYSVLYVGDPITYYIHHYW